MWYTNVSVYKYEEISEMHGKQVDLGRFEKTSEALTLVMIIQVGSSRKGSCELPLKSSVHDCRYPFRAETETRRNAVAEGV